MRWGFQAAVFCLLLSCGGQGRKSHRIGMPRRGKYMVKEDIEKAPAHDHPCNLTRTAVYISFPEMKSEVFMNLLGYKEPNLVYLMRCKGVCASLGTPISCTPTRVRDTVVNMRVKSFLTGQEPREKMRELVLEEHTACGCQCTPQLAAACGGEFNSVTCKCDCETQQVAELKLRCKARPGMLWDDRTCQCGGKNLVQRRAQGARDCGLQPSHYSLLTSERPSGWHMLAWVLLGASLTLVILLSLSSIYYWRRSRMLHITEEKDSSLEHLTKEEVAFTGASCRSDMLAEGDYLEQGGCEGMAEGEEPVSSE